jgi:hypothetical protein
MLSDRTKLLQTLVLMELLDSESEDDYGEIGFTEDSESSSDDDILLYLLLLERSRRSQDED